jgi:hypothetical protein
MNTPLTTRPWLPRFSLRVLLAAFTAVAIGFPVWYRWPYEEEVIALDPFDYDPPNDRAVITWQRQWGGDRLKHGPERTYRADGSKLHVTHYADGQRHGRFEAWEPQERLETVGYYDRDAMAGTWTTDTGHSKLVESWQNGQLHGPWEFQWESNPPERMRFTHGRLTEVNGQPWSSPLFDAHHRRETRGDSHAIDDNLYSNINSPITIDFQDTPLSAAAVHLSAEYPVGILPHGGVGTPILLDPRLADPNLPISGRLEGMDVKTALVLLLAKHGLVADYHYGAVWITTPELAGSWPDPTGIDKITPPEGSQLAQVWDDELDVSPNWRSPFYPSEQGLEEKIADAFGSLKIQIDTSRVAPTADDPERFPVVAYLQNIPFRHALAYLLYQAKCRCELRGETLVILPPAKEP